jgi:alanine racemase
LNGAYGDAHAAVLAAKLTPVVYSRAHVEAFARAAGSQPVDVHLKLDTGMARLGVPLDELSALLDVLAAFPNVRLDGVLTHLSSADSDPVETNTQLDRFEHALSAIAARGYQPRIVHAANSAAALSHPRARHDLSRVGLALYGVAPEGCEAIAAQLKPVMRVVTELLALRELPEGSPVGYDQTFRTARRSIVGTVPMGYGDGLMRAASNRGHMLVRGQRCPIIGRVSMDLTTLDLTDVPGCAVGDEVILLGEQQGASLSARDLAQACSTIAYEVLTNISPRVPRVYAASS